MRQSRAPGKLALRKRARLAQHLKALPDHGIVEIVHSDSPGSPPIPTLLAPA